MLQLRNTQDRYGALSIAFHWSMAVILIALAALGLYMVQLPDVGFDRTKIVLILFHKQLGMIALALTAARLAWRVSNVLPALVERIADWQKVLARLVHLCFYALMFALPITGWLMSSAAGIPISFLGVFELPDFIAQNELLFRAFIALHKWLAYALMALIVAHVGAAAQHHFIARDDTLRKILPGTSA